LNWGRGGKAEHLEKSECRKKMDEKSKSARFKIQARGTHTLPCE